MNRRSFLSSLVPLVGLIADPEQLLWTPKKTIFVPATPRLYVNPDFEILLRKIRERYDRATLADTIERFRQVRLGGLTYSWPIEHITVEEFRRRYPDSLYEPPKFH